MKQIAKNVPHKNTRCLKLILARAESTMPYSGKLLIRTQTIHSSYKNPTLNTKPIKFHSCYP